MSETTEYNIFQLANMADVASPDASDSPGAKWLARIGSDFDDRVNYLDEGEKLDQDIIQEAADSIVPIYTHEKWQVFVDLCAYNEDISEFGDYGDDLDRAGGIALYLIAERLYQALLDEHNEESTDLD